MTFLGANRNQLAMTQILERVVCVTRGLDLLNLGAVLGTQHAISQISHRQKILGSQFDRTSSHLHLNCLRNARSS
jgi:hypothetical protein